MNRFLTNKSKKRVFVCSKRGFSLIEVTMALGMVAFVMISVVGLLPLTLQTYHETKRETIHANLLQQLAANANLTPFSELSALNGQVFRYDDQGDELSSSVNTWVYRATFTISAPIALPGGSPSTGAKLLQVKIDDVDAPSRPTYYNIILGDQGG